jgi:hypothetical protein
VFHGRFIYSRIELSVAVKIAQNKLPIGGMSKNGAEIREDQADALPIILRLTEYLSASSEKISRSGLLTRLLFELH